ncbi:MAG TPA: RraA family protein [Pyrinomonadaceae bacterium]|nr:RraA family protein [Pyrinomonadaceae bacterium]
MIANLEIWKSLSAATISDALDRLGIHGQCAGIRPLDNNFKLVGRAFTVRTIPVAPVRGTVGDYIDDVAPEQVVILDNGGRLDATVWGDLLTTTAHRRSVAGTVIHGVCRDVIRSLELGYPLFSRGFYMRTGKDRVQAENFNIPVSLGEVRVEPDDLIVGDADGVLVIAKARESEVLEVSLSIHKAEEQIRAAVADGIRLSDARKQVSYFELQGESGARKP